MERADYKKIPFWENSRRLALLREFRSRVVAYRDSTKTDGMGFLEDSTRQEESESTRAWINKHLYEVHAVVAAARVCTVIHWTAPPAVGAYSRKLDVLMNIFGLHPFNIRLSTVIGYLDQAIGIYEQDVGRARVRTFNPLFWLGLFVEWLVHIPFRLVGLAGFDREKAEASVVGRVLKAIEYVVVCGAAFLAILSYLGRLDWFLALF